MKVEEELQNSSASKIKLLVNMALKGEISWINLTSLMDDLTPTLKKSKKVNKILLKELENFQSKLKESQLNPRGIYKCSEPEVIELDDSNEASSLVVEDEITIVETREEEANFDEAVLNQIIERSLIEQNSSSNIQETQSDQQQNEILGNSRPETSQTTNNICSLFGRYRRNLK